MPLFEVPGWIVPDGPVAESSNSRKRKRPATESETSLKLHSAEVNLEKLVKKLTGNGGGKERERPNKKAGKTLSKDPLPSRSRKQKRDDVADKKKTISHPMPLKSASERRDAAARPSKRAKTKHESSPFEEIQVDEEEEPAASVGLTSLQRSMKQSLDGARFRLINETLYKADSHEAQRMMQEDPDMFSEYHTGFRHQVQSWPTNPVEHYVSSLSKYPSKTVVADLGCGDAAIARGLIPNGMTVLSYDLVSNNSFVVEADICTCVPLPGGEAKEGEKSAGTGHVVDVVIFSLSLMGTNWPSSVREAWRILKPDGELKIAEVASRFSDLNAFIALVSSMGFKLKFKDTSNTHFTLFEFKKVARKFMEAEKWSSILSQGDLLKPCEYKRR
ncbi:hypothetical protein D9758_001179 [Tetrapyrgos nigripes]|uniref:Ribosomal RNA-processing protein 8 n=1 Tax=Tetrapyrgos nigripes TaxID=182062 RepID=A0A8H5GS49_9AGAR|nr:hypothetical protein D9758_001179 [Tetrapyrgos nigripes]